MVFIFCPSRSATTSLGKSHHTSPQIFCPHFQVDAKNTLFDDHCAQMIICIGYCNVHKEVAQPFSHGSAALQEVATVYIAFCLFSTGKKFYQFFLFKIYLLIVFITRTLSYTIIDIFNMRCIEQIPRNLKMSSHIRRYALPIIYEPYEIL